ncbi:MAG: aquaporin [Verrucomicrobia subdivision 3 bacterium]|nr:aquaporin [Limisphaerales bacterium]
MTVQSTLREHWPEYLIDGALLGLFMVSACSFAVLLEHPGSPVHQAISNQGLRRTLGGIAMGLTNIALIYSPWGQRSGAHMNPAVTLTFLSRGKVKWSDAAFYIAAQFFGGLSGVLLAKLALGGAVAHAAVNHAATTPGAAGPWVAFVAEVVIACGLMLMVLTVSNTPKLARFTGCFAGLLVALYITVEAPLSGMSMNAARTLASALPGQTWTALWVYFTAPFLGMLGAAALYQRFAATPRAGCAKMHHSLRHRCIFCGHPGQVKASVPPASKSTNVCKAAPPMTTH